MLAQISEAEEAIIAFVAAKGNAPLAAERLNMPVSLLYSLVASDPDTLSHYLKTMTLINTFEAVGLAHNSLKVALPQMEPFECAKTYTNLLQIAEALTRSHEAPQHTNILQIMQMFPQEVRESLQLLIDGGGNANGHSN